MTVSQGMTYALAVAMATFGVRAALDPRGAALAYGVPVPEGTAPTPFLEVKANRDVVLAELLVISTFASNLILSLVLFAGAVAPAADAWIVSRRGKPSGTRIHLGTVAYMIVAGVLAAAGH